LPSCIVNLAVLSFKANRDSYWINQEEYCNYNFNVTLSELEIVNMSSEVNTVQVLIVVMKMRV